MKRVLSITTLLLACLPLAAAGSSSCQPVTARNGMEYRSSQFLDAFAPSGDPRPAAILIHGRSGNRRTHLNQIQEVIEKAGWAWFSVDYGSAADLAAASDFIQCSGRFNIRGKPVLIGEDTGVKLAADLAAAGNFRSLVGFGTRLESPMKDPRLPVLLFHGDADDESAVATVQTVCQSWRNCTFVPVPKGIHNVENWHPDQWAWKEDLAAWLRSDQRGIWKDIAYSVPDGRPLLMDAFLPEGAGPFPAVIVVHGGGFEAGDKQTYISPALDMLARSGFVYFSIDYRLTPYVHNAEQLEDLRAAIRYVRAHAQRFHIRTDAISIMGESAGGQIVTQVASVPCPGCEVNAVVSLYGVYDFAQFTQQAGDRPMLDRVFGHWNQAMLDDASPIHHITKALPPLLLIQGTKDDLYAGTIAYDEALKAKGVDHKLVILDGAPHGMENWVDHPAWLKALDDAAVWLHQH